ncbi:hypothetical protein GUF45_27395, partial [Xanthomonas citri pv. citri]|nr:hypothetical protein [Xanthomonas citri pv. citri]
AGQDLLILAFPCNQFGKQEPGATPEEILNGIRYVRPGGDFVPAVDQFFEKSEVNGATEIPLYTYFKATCGMTADQFLTD